MQILYRRREADALHVACRARRRDLFLLEASAVSLQMAAQVVLLDVFQGEGRELGRAGQVRVDLDDFLVHALCLGVYRLDNLHCTVSSLPAEVI